MLPQLELASNSPVLLLTPIRPKLRHTSFPKVCGDASSTAINMLVPMIVFLVTIGVPSQTFPILGRVIQAKSHVSHDQKSL